MRPILPLAALAATVAVFVALRSAPDPVPQAVASDASPHATQRWAWQVGTAYRYALRYETRQAVHRAITEDQGLDVTGSADLASTLTWRVHAARPAGGWTVGVSLGAFTRHELRVLDQPVLDDAAVFDGQEVLLSVAADGQIEALHFAPETPSMVKHVLQGLAADLAWVVRPEPAWTVAARTTLGAVTDHYRAGAAAIERRRDYQTLLAAPGATPDGQGAATLHLRGGVLAQFEASESVRLHTDQVRAEGSTQLTLTLLEQSPFGADAALLSRLDALEARQLGVPVPTAQAHRNALLQRVAGLTADQLIDDLLRFGPAGRMPDHARWLWRATGLLTLHPELCTRLEAVFADESLGGPGRALVADLLAGTGHPQAQGSLRRALESPAARADRDHGLLLQRFSMVEAPTAETLDWLGEQLADETSHLPAAFALGSAIDRAQDPAQAQRLYGQLTAALDAEPAQRADLLRALGNTDRPEVADAALAHVEDADPEVRAGAAVALRAARSPSAMAALVDLAGDEAFAVAGAALDTLAEQSRRGRLPDDARAALARAVTMGQVHPQGFERLVGLLRDHPEALAAIAAHPATDAALRRRLAAL